MAVNLRRHPATRTGALLRVGEQLVINSETLRNWVSQAEIDEGHHYGVTTVEGQWVAELKREPDPVTHPLARRGYPEVQPEGRSLPYRESEMRFPANAIAAETRIAVNRMTPVLLSGWPASTLRRRSRLALINPAMAPRTTATARTVLMASPIGQLCHEGRICCTEW